MRPIRSSFKGISGLARAVRQGNNILMSMNCAASSCFPRKRESAFVNLELAASQRFSAAKRRSNYSRVRAR